MSRHSQFGRRLYSVEPAKTVPLQS